MMTRVQGQSWNLALVVVTSVVGGYLLNHLLNRSGSPQPQPSEARDIPIQMPSARVGAREDQVDRTLQQPSQSALDAGEPGSTGAAYDLDPQSITAG